MAIKPRLTPRKRPTQERSRTTVDAMLEATRRLLVQQGFEELNTNEVARISGVSVGSLYQYFPSKESLVTAALVQHREQLRERLTDVLEDTAADPGDTWALELSRAFVETYRDPTWLKIAFALVPQMKAARKLDPVDDESVAVLTAFFEHRGKTVDAAGDAELVFGMLNGTLRALARRAGDVIDDELVVDLGRAVISVVSEE